MMHDYNEMITELGSFPVLDIHDSIIFFGLTNPVVCGLDNITSNCFYSGCLKI